MRAATMTIQIYELCGANPNHLFSPHCWKVRMAVAHKGLPWETISVPFTKVASTEGGDSRRVPVIRDGDTVVEESYAIAKYLEATYADKPSLFGGPGGEALTLQIINWSQTTLHPEVAKLCLMDIYNALAPEDQAFFRASREKMFGCTLEEFDAKFPKNAEALNKALTPLALTLNQQPFVGGDAPLFADYVVFGALQWMNTTARTDYLTGDSDVSRWFDTLLDMYDGMGRKGKVAA
jgi:glutathione S-transferase